MIDAGFPHHPGGEPQPLGGIGGGEFLAEGMRRRGERRSDTDKGGSTRRWHCEEVKPGLSILLSVRLGNRSCGAERSFRSSA